MSVTVQVETGNPSTEEVHSVLRGLLEQLCHARTMADVAIAAGVALEVLNQLG